MGRLRDPFGRRGFGHSRTSYDAERLPWSAVRWGITRYRRLDADFGLGKDSGAPCHTGSAFMRSQRFSAVAIFSFLEDFFCDFAEFTRMLTVEGFDYSPFDSSVLAVGD